jgi:hypothetical protein
MATPSPSTRCDFYVYALFREDGVPFYIGKGRGNRWRQHEQLARKGAEGRKCNIIRDMQARGVAVIKVKLHEGLTHKVAYEYEHALISATGRYPNGPLVNCTDGGPGPSGIKLSPETIAKRSASVRGSKRSPEARANMSAAQIGRTVSQVARARISATKRGKKRSPEHIEKSVAPLRGRKLSARHAGKIAASKRGKPRPAGFGARVSAWQQGRKQTPEHIAKRTGGQLGRKASPEACANMRAAQRRLSKRLTPEQIARRTATRKMNSGGKYSASS